MILILLPLLMSLCKTLLFKMARDQKQHQHLHHHRLGLGTACILWTEWKDEISLLWMSFSVWSGEWELEERESISGADDVTKKASNCQWCDLKCMDSHLLRPWIFESSVFHYAMFNISAWSLSLLMLRVLTSALSFPVTCVTYQIWFILSSSTQLTLLYSCFHHPPGYLVACGLHAGVTSRLLCG